MKSLQALNRQLLLMLGMVLGSMMLTSCQGSSMTDTPNAAAPPAAPITQEANNAQATEIPRARPQLIKRANISLLVDSVEKSIDAVTQIIGKQQGDLIGLDERQPTQENSRYTASLQMRVPQDLLDSTLDELVKLGTVQSRSITAEDVGSQIVDFQARLSNLRKTETNLQKIMDRAGSVKDVLNVAQELSNVRQQIEQIDAQLKNLQDRVAYSTISLQLEATVAGTSPQRNFGSQIQETWNSSTQSLGDFTTGLLKMGIWLMVYSPYWLVFAIAAYYLRSRMQNQR